MDSGRRNFLTGGSTATTPSLLSNAEANPGSIKPKAADKQRWGMVIDLRKCIGCEACTVACSIENQVPNGQFRTIVSSYEVDINGLSTSAVLPRLCNHCEEPPCIPVCPVEATYQREDGIVVVDNTRCVGCAYCVQACPYDARFINSETNTADKCTFCVHRVEAGLLPACVETCVGAARIFGDLNDPNSEVSKLIIKHKTDGLNPDQGTHPQVYYIGLAGRLQSKIEGVPTLWNKAEATEQETAS